MISGPTYNPLLGNRGKESVNVISGPTYNPLLGNRRKESVQFAGLHVPLHSCWI